MGNSHPPHVTQFVVIAEFEVPETIDRRLPRNSTNDWADLILQRDILVAGSSRDEVRTFHIQCPELVNHERLVSILQRLKNTTDDRQCHSMEEGIEYIRQYV